MIEILVAIGIIMILLAIGVVGYRSLDTKASKDATRTAMNNLSGMMTNWEAAGNSINSLSVAVQAAAIASPGDVAPGSANRFNQQAVADTQTAIGRFRLIPQNKDLVSRLPARALMGDTIPSGAKVRSSPQNQNKADPPILVDGWDNPIILVPAGGIVVTVDGTNQTITHPGKRPFFASPGPDGNFDTGDDNLYSFEQQ